MVSKDLNFTVDEIAVLDKALSILSKHIASSGESDIKRLNGAIEYLALDYGIEMASTCSNCNNSCTTNCTVSCHGNGCKGDCSGTCKDTCRQTIKAEPMPP